MIPNSHLAILELHCLDFNLITMLDEGILHENNV